MVFLAYLSNKCVKLVFSLITALVKRTIAKGTSKTPSFSRNIRCNYQSQLFKQQIAGFAFHAIALVVIMLGVACYGFIGNTLPYDY